MFCNNLYLDQLSNKNGKRGVVSPSSQCADVWMRVDCAYRTSLSKEKTSRNNRSWVTVVIAKDRPLSRTYNESLIRSAHIPRHT